jgi:CheY-like chemotaxis protein
VLVVEDDNITRKAVGRKLQAAGYEVVMVPSAADALIVAQRMEFQVLVLDLQLPDPTDPFNGIYEGFAMLEWLHRQIGDFKFRIVVHTSQNSMHILQKADEHGVFAVCNKRRDFANLLQSVAQAVESLPPKAA